MRYESIGRHARVMVTSIEQSEVEREFLFGVTSFDSLSVLQHSQCVQSETGLIPSVAFSPFL